MIIYVIAQIFGVIAFVVSIVAYHRNKKKKILGNMIISNILNLLHYLLLGAYSGCITKTIAIIRDSFIIAKEKNKKIDKKIFLILFITLYIIVGLITYKNIWSIFPIIAATIYLVPIWNGDKEIVKKTALVCYFFWLTYNIFVLSIAGIFSNIISIISTFIAVMNVRKKR